MKIEDMTYDKMTAWAAANAILCWMGEPEADFGEWIGITEGRSPVDPQKAIAALLKHRGKSQSIEVYCLSGLDPNVSIDGEYYYTDQQSAIDAACMITKVNIGFLDLYKIIMPWTCLSTANVVKLLNYQHSGWRSEYIGQSKGGRFLPNTGGQS